MRIFSCAAALARALPALLLLPLLASAGDRKIQHEGWLPLSEALVQQLADAALTQATGIEDLTIELQASSAWITLDTRYWGAAHRLSLQVALQRVYVDARRMDLTIEVLGTPHIEARNFTGWLSRRAARRSLRRMMQRHDPPQTTADKPEPLHIDWPQLRLQLDNDLPWQDLGLVEGVAVDNARIRQQALELHWILDSAQLLRWLLPRP